MRALKTLITLTVLLLGAYFLRVFRLDAQSIWWDEGISLHLATSGLSEIVRDRLNNIHPPLYFLILKIWINMVGVSPFAGRYLSALAGLSQVALVFGAMVYWGRSNPGDSDGPHWRAPAWIAAFLVAVAPLSIIYSQEIRVYAMLPLVYLSMLLLTGQVIREGGGRTQTLLWLGLVEWIGLHLHYITLFALVFVGVWGVVALFRQSERRGLWRWLGLQALVALLSLPWLAAVAVNWAAVQAEANAGTFTTKAVPLGFLAAQVWVFHLTGLAGALGDPFVRVTAVVAAALFLWLLVVHLIRPARRAPTLRLLVFWALPLLSALLVWSVRSFSHPRYVVMFALLFFPLAALLLVSNHRSIDRLAAVAFAVTLLALGAWGLQRYYFDPQTAKADMRSVARYLEATAGPGDLILIPDTDWSLPFEYGGRAEVAMPHLTQSPHDPAADLFQSLRCADPSQTGCSSTGRVFVVDYKRGARDWQDRLPFELERHGALASVWEADELVVREYRLEKAPAPLPACEATGETGFRPIGVRFGPLLLRSAWIETGAASDTALAVALCWQLPAPATEDYVASLVMSDVTGEIPAQADRLLLDAIGRPTSLWTPGATVVTYHQLTPAIGAPPLDYELTAAVYPAAGDAPLGEAGLLEAIDPAGQPLGRKTSLGRVQMTPPDGIEPGLYRPPAITFPAGPVEAADGLQLLGATGISGDYRPGQTIRLRLLWRALDSPPAEAIPVLRLERDGKTLAAVAEAHAQGRYPVALWRPGELVAEMRSIRIPTDIPPGPALVRLALDGHEVELGHITVAETDARFDPPETAVEADAVFDGVIRLHGFELPQASVTTADAVPLTLHWQSLTGEVGGEYAIFAHILADDGRLIGQHDGIPDNGRRPTGEWLEGEYVADSHLLVFNEPAYTGPARIQVGLYDPQTGRRLPTSSGQDAFVLPVELTVLAPAQ